MDSILQAGVVSAPLQVIIDRLATFTVNETSLILGVDEHVRKLQRTIERIKAMVDHVENYCIFSNEAWKIMWLEDVENLLYSADDLLDGISLDMLKCSSNNGGGNQVRNMLLSSFKLTVPREISGITQSLEDIAKEMDALFMTELNKLNFNKVFKSGCGYGSSSSSSSSSYLCGRGSSVNGIVVGRERERDKIVELVLADHLNAWERNVSVIAIVGMGGIGKTTIAQLVYKDDRVVERFDLRIWVSVSVDFDVIRITKSIIESVTGERCKLCDLDPIQVKLQDLIKMKRFLLVLDDYWSEGYRDWDVLSSPFNAGRLGSKIIVTTRSTTVSQILGSIRSYYLQTMTDESCWELMRRRVFSNNGWVENSGFGGVALQGAENLHFERIGRMIAMKCRGLPLAAVTLGSMLSLKYDIAEWKIVLKSEIWDLPMGKNDILPALALSYHHLPAHLKKCFAYCSIFPKNYEFGMEDLVLSWMSEGLIHPVGKLRLEDLGVDYFKDLTLRSFFQASHVNNRGQQIYKMHDLIHSVAQLVSARTCLRLEDKMPNEEYPFFRNTRHFSLHYDSATNLMLKGFPWFSNLRTLRVTCEHIGILQVSYDLFLKMKSLRVLDLSRTGLVELPDSIEHLKHLRYLNLSENPIKKLPNSITNLFGLQILKLDRCIQLLELPFHMKEMISLRHLHLNIRQLNRMPSGFGRLVNLQSLSVFIVGRNINGCGIGELKNMKFLRGSICIKNLENVSNVDEAKEATLALKPGLDKLELEWDGPRSGNVEEQILAGLCPHENLKELSITNYNGVMLPSWLGNPLCKLSSIHLQSCQHHGILTPLGRLQNLKSLHIEDMSNCLYLNQELSGFPSLEYLTIKDMPSLTYWLLISGGSFPCLHTLSVIDCPQLTNLPSLISLDCLLLLTINRCPEIESLPGDGLPVSLQSLVISESDKIKDRCRTEEGEDWYKIRNIPKVEVDYVDIHPELRRF